MRIYGFLLEELKFKPDSPLPYFLRKMEDDCLPMQVESGYDRNGENPSFGLAQVFTRSACDFEDLDEARAFLCDHIKPYLDMEENDIYNTCDEFGIADTEDI